MLFIHPGSESVVTLSGGDNRIGAVEIQDRDTNNRAQVTLAGELLVRPGGPVDVTLSGNVIPEIPNTPVVFTPELINDDAFHMIDNGGLTIGARYDIILKNAPVASGGAPSNYVEGWVKLAATADGPAYMDGEPIIVNTPMPITPAGSKNRLSFTRSTDTNFPCQVFVIRRDI